MPYSSYVINVTHTHIVTTYRLKNGRHVNVRQSEQFRQILGQFLLAFPQMTLLAHVCIALSFHPFTTFREKSSLYLRRCDWTERRATSLTLCPFRVVCAVVSTHHRPAQPTKSNSVREGILSSTWNITKVHIRSCQSNLLELKLSLHLLLSFRHHCV